MVDSTVKEIAGLLETEEMQRPEERVTLPNSHISFRNVCFGYGNTEVLHQISFDAVPGGMTAIVGPPAQASQAAARLIASSGGGQRRSTDWRHGRAEYSLIAGHGYRGLCGPRTIFCFICP